MTPFQQTVLYGAAALWGLFVVVASYIAYHTAKPYEDDIPGEPAACPDYWVLRDNNRGAVVCENVHSLGSCNIPVNMFVSHPGVDVIGRSAAELRGVGVQDCQAACLEDDRCVAATYRSSDQRCQLKDAAAPEMRVDDELVELYVKNMGGDRNAKDFGTPDFTGQRGRVNKARWAKNCGVTWEFVSS